MLEIIKLLPVLSVAIMLNIATGTWYNIDVTKIKFNKRKFLNGLFKALIVSLSFIGLAYIVSAVPQIAEQLPMLPTVVMISAIALYTVKATLSLMKILGVNTSK